MTEYEEFLRRKLPRAASHGVACDESALAPALFDFQRHCAAFAVQQGRCGIYLDTGLGKTAIELAFADAALRLGGARRALLLAPLAVAQQIAREADKLQIGDVRVIRDQAGATPGINVCNYDRLDKIDPQAFDVVVLDEASILKSFTGKTTRALIDAFAAHRWRLSATATPAPNDHMELGQQAEFLGVMPSNEMLMRWFTADQTQMGRYRLKRHGEHDFWDWMASWSRLAQSPEDLGFDGSRYALPPLKIIRHMVAADVKPLDGTLFAYDTSATGVHTIKRQTTDARADSIAALVSYEEAEPWVIWCDTDYEADALIARIPDAAEVRGSHAIERKEETLAAFAAGQARALITKPSICGFGLNWQHAARVAFVGRSFSYEAWYQAVRRCWRFGQTRPVHVHIAVADGEDQIGRVICPVREMTKTKAHGLLYKQLRADSTFSRQGLPEYLLVFRRWAEDGQEVRPVTHTHDSFPLEQWQKWASPVWEDTRETDVLNASRDPNDEKHICPMPLDLTTRAICLWSNPGDVVLSPFMGIGSEGVAALRAGRRFVGVELKASYWQQACEHLHALSAQAEFFSGAATA
jgi:hypothetical protein